MADKLDKKLAASSLLQVTVEKKKKKAPLFPVTAVQLASLWAILTAVILVASFAVACTLVKHHIEPPSWMLAPGAELTDAGAAEVMTIIHGVAWCSAAQTAAAALALLLPDGRCRRALAYAALAATATSHLMLARAIALVLAADPGCILLWFVGSFDISYLAVGDLYCFMALLGRGAYAD